MSAEYWTENENRKCNQIACSDFVSKEDKKITLIVHVENEKIGLLSVFSSFFHSLAIVFIESEDTYGGHEKNAARTQRLVPSHF